MMHVATPKITVFIVCLIVLAGCDRPADWVEGECEDGELDRPRYCDRSGDLVADLPEDAEGLDPDTLIFAYTPVEDPAQYREVWDDFMDHLEDVTGREVQFFAAQSNAAQIEAMRAGRLHIAGFATGSVPLAVNCAGFVPATMMADGDEYGYEMEIITHVDSGLDSIEDITPEHTFAFTSPTSNSGFKTPTVLLRDEYGMEADADFEAEYSGGHDNSLIGVHRQDYDAAAVANEVTNRIMERGLQDDDDDDGFELPLIGRGCVPGPEDDDDDDDAGGSDIPREDIEVLYRSETFPTTAFGHAYNLDEDLADKVVEAFVTFPWEGPLAEEFSDSDRFKQIDYQEHWEMIREVDAHFEDGYSCR